MKRFLLLLLLLATPARADDSITALTWNSAKGTFQALTRALGWKYIPDEDSGTFTVAVTGATSLPTFTITYSRVGKTVTLNSPPTGLRTCTATTIQWAAGSIPATLRPTATTVRVAAMPINNAGADSQNGAATLGTDGSLTVYASISGTGNWTAGNCQIYAWSATYSTNF